MINLFYNGLINSVLLKNIFHYFIVTAGYRIRSNCFIQSRQKTYCSAIFTTKQTAQFDIIFI